MPYIATLYYGFPRFIVVNKGSTPLITPLFKIKNSILNSGVVVTTILPLRERDTIEMTNSLIPFSLKARFKAFRVFILEKVFAWIFHACKRVHLLVRANLPLPQLVPILIVSLGPRLVVLALALFPFGRILVHWSEFPWFLLVFATLA